MVQWYAVQAFNYKIDLSQLFPVNDCENAPNERQKYVVLVFLTKCFILAPSGHPQSMVNLDTMITCDWPPSHY